jgi:hypothetical protein
MNSTRLVNCAAIAALALITFSNILYFNPVYSQIGNSSNNPSLNLSSLITSLVKPISGLYDNPSLGYRIELPPGWNGTEMNVLTQMVIAVPAGSSSLFKNGLNPSDVEKNHTMMTIIGIDKKAFDTLKNIAQSMLSGANISSMTNMFDQYKKDAKCDKTVAPVVINGATGQQISYECQGPLFAGKIRAYAFATKDDSLIQVSFFGNSNSGFDKYLPQFEDSIKTLKISNPIDIQSSQVFREYQKFAGLDNNQTAGN